DADPGSSERRGWVNRMIGLTALESAFEGVGLASGTPASMSGPSAVMSMSSIDSASVPGATQGDASLKADRRRAQLAMMVGGETDKPFRQGIAFVCASPTHQC